MSILTESPFSFITYSSRLLILPLFLYLFPSSPILSLTQNNMYTFTPEEQRKASPEVLLTRMLSTKAYLSSSPVRTERSQFEDTSSPMYTSIGEGQCGIVFALKGTPDVIKIAKSPEKAAELWQDATVHNKIRTALRSIPSSLRQDINVPIYEGWVNHKSTDFWDTQTQYFLPGTQIPYYGLISERIHPLPLPVRTAILDALCSKSIRKRKDAFLEKPENQDCLIRLYLGRRSCDNSKNENIRLRNFPLHVNEMEGLKLDTNIYAVTMARSLAMMHWAARVDANDVEFVLGCSPAKSSVKPTDEEMDARDMDSGNELHRWDFMHRSVSIWLLDFNQRKPFEHNSQGLKQLVDGFWWNDPYYPIPGSKNDEKLWNVFKNAYLEASGELGGVHMAKDFIEAVEERGTRRSGGLFGN
jgi:hypothetical protein